MLERIATAGAVSAAFADGALRGQSTLGREDAGAHHAGPFTNISTPSSRRRNRARTSPQDGHSPEFGGGGEHVQPGPRHAGQGSEPGIHSQEGSALTALLIAIETRLGLLLGAAFTGIRRWRGTPAIGAKARRAAEGARNPLAGRVCPTAGGVGILLAAIYLRGQRGLAALDVESKRAVFLRGQRLFAAGRKQPDCRYEERGAEVRQERTAFDCLVRRMVILRVCS